MKTALATAKTSAELEQFRKDHPELKAEQLSLVDTKINELEKKERAKAESEKFEQWLKNRGYKYGSSTTGLTPKMLASLKRQYMEANK